MVKKQTYLNLFISIILSTLVMAYYTYILFLAYGWFIRPVYGTMELGYTQLFGTLMFIDLIKARKAKLDEENEIDLEKPIKMVIYLVFVHIFTWLVKLVIV